MATHNTLGVTVLSSHGEVEPEQVAVDHVDITCLRAAQGVDSPVERLIRADLYCDPCILAVHRY